MKEAGALLEQATDETTDLLHTLLKSKKTHTNENIRGIIIGSICAIDDEGQLWINHSGIKFPLVAMTICAVSPNDIDRQCALMFENGDPAHPIVMGLLHHPVLTINTIEEQQDIKAVEKIELQCGKASLTLSADGKIELRGTKITSHSTGLNQIRGASVKLN
ncbi:DUF6484 domain-containing protein [Cellvibrio sp. UBA7661]|uniref:DUF6484 domain-containing protein n=1 Tax=Cellvibrio sp. UBA7661 TaxID=1946311 RepID=UPI002F35392F